MRARCGGCSWRSSPATCPRASDPSTASRASERRGFTSGCSSATATTRSARWEAPTWPASGSPTSSPRSSSAAGWPPIWSSRRATSPTTSRFHGGGYRYYREHQLGEPYDGGHGRALPDLLAQPRGGSVLGGGAVAAGRGARGRVATLDPRQIPGPAAGRSPGLDAQPRGHLRLGPGLRAAAPAPDGLAAAGGAGVRRHDPHGAGQGDPELRGAHRASRSRRRVDRLSARAPPDHRAGGGAAGPGPPGRLPRRRRSS